MLLEELHARWEGKKAAVDSKVLEYEKLFDEAEDKITGSVRTDDDEEEFEEGDADQEFAQALSLLAKARHLLINFDKFLDARNLSLTDESDAFLCSVLLDIGEFLDFYKTGKPEVKEEKSTTIMGPVGKIPWKFSWGCSHKSHADCDLPECDCPCHDEETKE
jgi:hypothetical protein